MRVPVQQQMEALMARLAAYFIARRDGLVPGAVEYTGQADPTIEND